MSIFGPYVTKNQQRPKPDLGSEWNAFLEDVFEDDKYCNNGGLYEHLERLEKNMRRNTCPKIDDIFRCFRATPLWNLKCVILGHDPYPWRKYADGLCFSIKNQKCFNKVIKGYTARGKALKTLFDECKEEMHSLNMNPSSPTYKTLEEWAGRGVLLLNGVLAIERNKSITKWNGYTKHWRWFTTAVVRKIHEHCPHCVIIFLGGFWKTLATGMNANSCPNIFWYMHPSGNHKKNNNMKNFKHGDIFLNTLKYLYSNQISAQKFGNLFPLP